MVDKRSTAVTWRTLIFTAVALLLLMTVIAGAAGYWAWGHLAAQVVLRDQVADVNLPKELEVRATVSNKVQVKLDQMIHVKVPIHEELTVPITEPIPLTVSVETTVPIHLDVPVEHMLHVEQVIDLDTTVKTRILGFPITLPIKGKVPLKADVPINLVIPVRKQLPISLTTPALIRMTEPLKVRVDTVLDTRVPIRETMSLPVTSAVNATLTFPGKRVEAGLERMDITLPLDAIHLGPKAERKP